MKRIALAVALLASLGAACAKAEAETPKPWAAVGASVRQADGLTKAAMAQAGLTNFTGLTVDDLSDGLTKAAMVEAGLTNISGIAP